ncbi:MAG: hypothetical protein JO117_09610 [Verrucomicrobia bacterium]|nr:hypothetical protein [Verrucomicrobiota bacterium]
MNPPEPTPGLPARGAVRPALILPACHEEETIVPVLDELRATLDPVDDWIVAVGVNGSPAGVDRTAELARQHPLAPVVAETPARGYGHGCQAAIDQLEALGLIPSAYLFFAADGANDARDLSKLLDAHRAGFNFVVGSRTAPLGGQNLAVMGWPHVLANRILGVWCGLLTGRWFQDIGPLRLIESELFRRLQLRDWSFGWTIEAQITAARLGAAMIEIPVRERPRLAGQQKVSKVNWRRTLLIGGQIALAGWRTRLRALASAPHATSARPHAHPSPSSTTEPVGAR